MSRCLQIFLCGFALFISSCKKDKNATEYALNYNKYFYYSNFQNINSISEESILNPIININLVDGFTFNGNVYSVSFPFREEVGNRIPNQDNSGNIVNLDSIDFLYQFRYVYYPDNRNNIQDNFFIIESYRYVKTDLVPVNSFPQQNRRIFEINFRYNLFVTESWQKDDQPPFVLHKNQYRIEGRAKKYIYFNEL